MGSEIYGILSNPFLDKNFRTLSYRMHVTVHPDGTWSYEEEGMLVIPGQAEPFPHIDRNTLTRIAPPTPNPLAARDEDGRRSREDAPTGVARRTPPCPTPPRTARSTGSGCSTSVRSSWARWPPRSWATSAPT